MIKTVIFLSCCLGTFLYRSYQAPPVPHQRENTTGVGVTSYREEIVTGQVVYLSEHGIEAVN